MSETKFADRRTLLKTLSGLGFGAAAMLTSDTSAAAADRSPSEQANIQLVNDFCASWSTRDVNKALPFLADDCVWNN